MRRRMIWATAVLAVLLVLPAAPAAAAESELLLPDGEVTEPTELRLELTQEFGAERFAEVHATLRRDDERVGESVRLECVEGCDREGRVAMFALPEGGVLDASTGAPFTGETLANGAYRLRIDLDRGRFQSPQTFEHDLDLRVPASPPTDLGATVADDEVELVWTRSPEPDVAAYRVERNDGEGWVDRETTSASGAVVAAPGEGEHRYRVVALRPDGGDGQLETASDEVAVEIEPEDDEGTEREDGDDGDDGGNGRSGGNGEDRREDDDADADEAPPSDGDETASTDEDRSNGSSRARAPAVPDHETGGSSSGAVPRVGDDDDGDDGYAAELDYGEHAGDDSVEVATPSGWRGATDRLLDAEQVAVPIAVGLVMTASGLHLWRWLRVT